MISEREREGWGEAHQIFVNTPVVLRERAGEGGRQREEGDKEAMS